MRTNPALQKSTNEGSRGLFKDKRHFPAISLLAIVFIVAAACGGGGGDASKTVVATEATTEQTKEAPAKAADLAPDFTLSVYQGDDVLGGTELQFHDLIGKGTPVILNFWAGLCPPCRAEMPDLQEFYDENKDRVLLFGLDIGPFVRLGSRQDGKDLLQALKITYPAGTTLDRDVVANYRVLGMPSTYFISGDGMIFRTWTGLLNKDVLQRTIDEMLESD